ncbi:hypothetical protein Daus18300_000775 [Diaporthe australafricana]|uniref:Uncharacterized protein n=1 Tax=Diaporthe australafricana TaxID=127596 RepID=A0ABR3Y3I0_9PEZI
MTGLQPDGAPVPHFGLPNNPGVYQQLGSNSLTGLRAPVPPPLNIAAAQGSYQWEPSLGFTTNYSGPAAHQNPIPFGYDGRASSAYPSSYMGPMPSAPAIQPVYGPRLLQTWEAVEGSQGLDRGTKRTRAEDDEGDGGEEEDGDGRSRGRGRSGGRGRPRGRGDAPASETAPEHTPQHTDKKPKRG